MSSIARKLPSSMTADEFLAWDGDGTKYELVDGTLRGMSPGSATHGLIQANLAALLKSHLAGSRCRIVTEPAVRIRLFGNNIRNPDLGVTCSKIGPADIDLPDPVLLIEVLSPGNKADTYDNVRAYASIPSVREVILFASTRIEAQMLLRGADGAWPAEPTRVISGQRLTFSSVDLELPIEAAYEGTYLVEAQT